MGRVESVRNTDLEQARLPRPSLGQDPLMSDGGAECDCSLSKLEKNFCSFTTVWLVVGLKANGCEIPRSSASYGKLGLELSYDRRDNLLQVRCRLASTRNARIRWKQRRPSRLCEVIVNMPFKCENTAREQIGNDCIPRLSLRLDDNTNSSDSCPTP